MGIALKMPATRTKSLARPLRAHSTVSLKGPQKFAEIQSQLCGKYVIKFRNTQFARQRFGEVRFAPD